MARAMGICDLCGRVVTSVNLAAYDEDGHVYCTNNHWHFEFARVNNGWQLKRNDREG